jgi:hypothetical protein
MDQSAAVQHCGCEHRPENVAAGKTHSVRDQCRHARGDDQDRDFRDRIGNREITRWR